MAKKKKLTEAEKAKQQEYIKRMTSFQERLPIDDIKNRLYVSQKGEFFPAFAVGQRSIDLMSDEELYNFSRQLEMTFQALGVQTMQFLLLPVPFDLAPYRKIQDARYNSIKKELNELNDKLAKGVIPEDKLEATYKRQGQLKSFIEYIEKQNYFVTANMNTGKVANKHCYLIASIKDRWNETTVQEAADMIEDALKQLSEESHRCTVKEMENILIELFNPLRPDIYTNQA